MRGPWGALPHLSNHVNNPILHCSAWQPGPLQRLFTLIFFFFFFPPSFALLVYIVHAHARARTNVHADTPLDSRGACVL